MLKSLACIIATAWIGTLACKGVIGQFNEANYHVSPNPASWVNAVSDCQRAFDPRSHLLSIESGEEMSWINDYLEQYGLGVSYWTSGRFDSSKNSKFRWGANGKGVPAAAPWFKWAPGHPPAAESTVQRIAISHRSTDDSDFEVYSSSSLRRYICEIPDENVTIPVPCYETNDIFIVLDSSGSISEQDYQIAKEFVVKLVQAFSVHNQNRIGMSIFSGNVNVVFPLDYATNPANLNDQIMMAVHTKGSTATHLALDNAVSQTIPIRRDGIPQNVVVFTDGRSSDVWLTSAAAKRALESGLRMFAIGIGNYNEGELKEISGNVADRLFTVNQFNELIQILRPLSTRICPDYEDNAVNMLI